MNNPFFQGLQRPIDHVDYEEDHFYCAHSIQSHGALLCLNEEGALVSRSANAEAYLGSLPEIGEILTEQHLVAPLRASIQLALRDRSGYAESLLVTLPFGVFDLVMHKADGLLFAEFEHRPAESISLETLSLAAHSSFQRLQRKQSIDDLITCAVSEVALITGFDRVVAYHFIDDGSSEVVAEYRREDLEPFSAAVHPAMSPSRQAHYMQAVNSISVIADINSPAVPLEPLRYQAGEMPLDLSLSILRSASPKDLDYLANLGVNASMSFPIVSGDHLWGLISCYHMAPRLAPHPMRMSCQLITQFVSAMVERNLNIERARATERNMAIRSRIVAHAMDREDIVSALAAEGESLLSLVNSSGGAISLDRKTQTVGQSPAQEDINSLINWFNEKNPGDVFYTSDIVAAVPSLKERLGNVRGMLAARFYRERNGFVFWFRNAQETEEICGNDFEKVFTKNRLLPNSSPEISFAISQEIKPEKSLQWTQIQLEAAVKLRLDLQEVALSNENMLKRARENLLATLGHDLRDPLQAIMMSARMMEIREGNDVASKLSQRISASSGRMHRLISQILDLSRLQSGLGLQIHRAPLDVRRMTGEIVSEARLAYPDNEIILEAEDCGDVELDGDRISQVISNLLSNSRHHGEPGMPSTLMAFRRGPTLVISVSNYGAPIPEALRRDLFKPYKKSSLGNRRNSRGLGLGLYIVGEIVRGHNGKICVECEHNIVTFIVELPAK